MRQSLLKLSCIAMVGACCAVRPATAYVFPIASMVEWPNEIMLLFESEVKRWEHEAIKYKELLYTDMMGKDGVGGQGDGSLGTNPIIGSVQNEQAGTLKTDAIHGASSIRKSRKVYDAADDASDTDDPSKGTEFVYLDKDGNTLIGVDELANYSSSKSKIESNYVIQPDKFQKYSETEYAKIQENQRIAVNNLAKSALIVSATETKTDQSNLANLDPSKAAENIAAATDMNAMFELMVGLDQRVYEKMLRTSNMEATNVELKSMQTLQGLFGVNPNKEGEDNE